MIVFRKRLLRVGMWWLDLLLSFNPYRVAETILRVIVAILAGAVAAVPPWALFDVSYRDLFVFCAAAWATFDLLASWFHWVTSPGPASPRVVSGGEA